MQHPPFEEPDFGGGFDPAQVALEYLREHNAGTWAIGLVILFALFALVIGQPAS